VTRFPCRFDWPVAACVAAMLTWPMASAGQETRWDEHEHAQETKSTIVKPSAPNVVERGLRTIKSLGLFTGVRDGFYPEATSIYPGGALAFGGGYRRPVGDAGSLDVSSAWSLRNFKSVDATLLVPTRYGDRLSLKLQGRWMDAPSVAFYGVGNDARSEDKTTYAYRPTTVGLSLSAAPAESITLGGSVGLLLIDTVSIAAASSSAVAGLTSPPPAASAAGLARSPRYVRSRAFAQLDWRQEPGYTGSGGLYRVEVQDYADRSGSHLSFRSAEAEVVQLVPILRANWVIALRGLATVTDNGPADAVPFYLMPSLGGSVGVRGYPSFRFVGNHRLLMDAECRWTATRYLDMAVFYDTGKVAARIEDLDLRRLKSAYGIGARFHGSSRTVLRMEVARNNEGGWRFVWTAGAAF
jgi:outer membrane protein assembly factor BamA